MDEFTPGTPEYDQAHGLYRTKRGRLLVISPGTRPPRRAERVQSVAHPGAVRDAIHTHGHATVDAILQAGTAGPAPQASAQGVDISEFQSSTPGGFDFYVNRYLNEYGRVDSMAATHYANTAGHVRGSYGIIKPGLIDATTWAARYVDLLRQWPHEMLPTIDIELGDANANAAYASVVNAVLRGAGYRVLIGYYSRDSAYRQTCSGLYDRQWLAAYGSAYPAGADMHQWQGAPLDRDYTPDLAHLTGAAAPAPPPPEAWRHGEEETRG